MQQLTCLEPGKLAWRGVPAPRLQGDGEVTALGVGVRGLAVGRRVVVSFQVSCGRCATCAQSPSSSHTQRAWRRNCMGTRSPSNGHRGTRFHPGFSRCSPRREESSTGRTRRARARRPIRARAAYPGARPDRVSAERSPLELRLVERDVRAGRRSWCGPRHAAQRLDAQLRPPATASCWAAVF